MIKFRFLELKLMQLMQLTIRIKKYFNSTMKRLWKSFKAALTHALCLQKQTTTQTGH